MTTIEVGDDLLGFLKDFGAFDGGFSDRDFAMRAASMEGEADFISIIIPIKSVFHFVAVIIVVAIGNN